jgi:hypothetical protein
MAKPVQCRQERLVPDVAGNFQDKVRLKATGHRLAHQTALAVLRPEAPA